ncbi:PoNe immunity protein domain-containing protein [Paraburkholderia bannensis]|uniref:PoNe immunity protein domain-containing protein n=1 Tax=Paraburkholderia bannensis TaxID=765414 RepID=UPI002AB7E22B|nr:PoNe immunity protein domain-containing protein [Paraburkholderia bannensis]
MNESFDKFKREPLLPEHHYREKLEYKEKRLEKLEQMLEAPEKFPGHKRGLSWDRCTISLEILIARYSAGEELSSLKPNAIRCFDLFKSHYAAYPDYGRLRLWEPDAYQYVMWLLSLAVVLGLKEWVPTIATWISTDPEDGQDVLVSRLFGQFGVSLPGDSLIHEKPYADLLRATETQGEAQQHAMADYLKHWYGGMKVCYWYDGHKNLGVFFFGYWAFEAGLVTLLRNIDDSGYRDKRFYPKDLVDYARKHGTLTQGDTPKPHISRMTGEQCPHAGRWGVLESPGAFVQERFFNVGDVFPKGIRSDRSEGPVTWIVMGREDGGPTREA